MRSNSNAIWMIAENVSILHAYAHVNPALKVSYQGEEASYLNTRPNITYYLSTPEYLSPYFTKISFLPFSILSLRFSLLQPYHRREMLVQIVIQVSVISFTSYTGKIEM